MGTWSIKGNVPTSTVVCIDLQAHHVSVHIHTVQTQTRMQIDHSNPSPHFSFHIKRKLLIKPYVWNTHLHMFTALWWVVFLCTVLDRTWLWVAFPLWIVFYSFMVCVGIYLTWNVVLAVLCDIDGASCGLWTQGRHSLPSSAGWWVGGCCSAVSEPPSTSYAPDSCILIPAPYLTSRLYTLTHSLGPQPPLPIFFAMFP